MNTYKKFVLCALNRVFRFEESEADKETPDDVQTKLRQEVRGVAPISQILPSKEDPSLVTPWGCKPGRDRCCDRRM